MMKLVKKFIIQKWFYLYFVPLMLLIMGSLVTFWNIINLDAHYTVMPIIHSETGALQIPSHLVVDGDIIRGEFVASETNLGAIDIAIRNRYEKIVDDDFKMFFRMKEKGAKDWYSINSYSGGQFQELDQFPFGFALIPDSKGKTYIYELFSKGANAKNALTIADTPSITTLHPLNKSDLKKPVFAMHYLIGKLWYAMQNISALYASIVYFVPLYTYFYFLHESKVNRLPKFFSYILLIHAVEKYIVPSVVKLLNILMNFLVKAHIIDESSTIGHLPSVNVVLFVIIVGEIFLIKGINNLLLLIIISLWALSVFLYKFRVDSSYLIAIFFLLLCFVFYLFGLESFAEKAAIWTYLFFIVGALQMLCVPGTLKK